jgi:hypothetical protein
MERGGVNDASPLHGDLQVLRIRECLRFPDIGHVKQDDHIVRIIDSLIYPTTCEARSFADGSMLVILLLPCGKLLDPVTNNQQAHFVSSLSWWLSATSGRTDFVGLASVIDGGTLTINGGHVRLQVVKRQSLAATRPGKIRNLPLTSSGQDGRMRTPDISQQDQALVAVVAAFERFPKALLPLSLISTVTLAGVMLSVFA